MNQLNQPVVEVPGPRDPVDIRLEGLRNQLVPPDAPAAMAVCSTHQQLCDLIQQMSVAHSGAIGLAVLPIEGDSIGGRLVSWVRAVRRLRFTEGVAERAGLRIDRRLGVFPSIDSPKIVFELQGAAGRYAEAELLPEPMRGMRAQVKSVLRRVGGMSSALGGVVMVIKKS